MDSLVSVYGDEVAARLRNWVNWQPAYSEHVVEAVLRTLAIQTWRNQKQVLQAINNALNWEKNTQLASWKTSQIWEDSANSANDSLPYTLQA